MNTAMQLMPLVLLIFIMYFLLIRPQKKREKATTQMRNNVQVGDEVVTIGGVCGKIVKVKDESLIIQVGAEKVKFEIMRWAVSKIVNSDPAASFKKSKAPAEETAAEAPKKVLPKKMMAKKQEEPEEIVKEIIEEKIVDVPEEDIKIVEENKVEN